MQAKFRKGTDNPSPLPKTALPTDVSPPAAGLSAAFASALGLKGAGLHIGGRLEAQRRSGPESRPDQINKAPKPAGVANRHAAPHRGQR